MIRLIEGIIVGLALGKLVTFNEFIVGVQKLVEYVQGLV